MPLWPSAASAVCLGLVATAPLRVSAATHYSQPPCNGDDVQAEVLGESGYFCTPKCAENSYDCPTDIPDLAAARPQCMLQDVDRGAYCALQCTVDTQCPSGATCQKIAQVGVGLCLYPLAFADWVRQSKSIKLTFGLPQRGAGGQPATAIVTKAVAAVQNLKQKYGIQDGDADVTTVKEFLATLAGGTVTGTGVVTAASNTVVVAPGSSTPQQAASAPAGSSWGAVGRDVDYELKHLGQGLPGLQAQAHDALWNLEHLDHKHASWNTLRGLLEIVALYLIIGMVYKHQALGSRGIDMIPHISFWMEYPRLVNDGVAYTKVLLGSYVGESSQNSRFRGSGFEPLSSNERDTFAHFEPSK